MMDREYIKRAFKSYTDAYDSSDPKVKLKIDHTYRVADLADKIARSIGLDEEDVDLAWLLGILHDIGRFEQLSRYHTFNDRRSVDHAKLSADLLHEGLGDIFVPKDVDYNLVEKAVRLHNVLELPKDLTKRENMFCDILRDADKIDILRVNCETPREQIYDLPPERFANDQVSDLVMQDILSKRSVNRQNAKTAVDPIVGQISFIFGLVYPWSVEEMKRQGYLDQMLHFESQNEKTRADFAQIQEIVNNFEVK